MSISNNLNTEALQQLQMFAAFFDFVKNPGKYEALIADTNETLDEMKEVIAAYTTVANAKVFLSVAEQMKGQAEQMLTEAEAVKGKAAQESAKILQLANEQISVRRAKLIAEAEETEKKSKKATEMLVQAEAKSKEIVAKEAYLAQYKQDLETAKTSLEEKAKQVKDLIAKIG